MWLVKHIGLWAFVLLVKCFGYSEQLDSLCGNWSSFKDEKCYKLLDGSTKTFKDAEKTCEQLESGATLPTIHSKDENDFLATFLFNTSGKVNNFWIGGHYVNNAYGWVDKSNFSYTNWDAKGPRSKANYCVQMQYDETDPGKWHDDPCEKDYAVVCQKMQTWSLARFQQTFLDARKELRDALVEANKRNDEAVMQITLQKHEIDEANKKINILEKNQIPIGFIYTQLPNQKPPTSIWPSMTWTEISSDYAGVFFRVNGGNSESFGQTQAENAPRLIKVQLSDIEQPHEQLFDVSSFSESTRTSPWFFTGNYYGAHAFFNLRFMVSGGEVRPRNMAIRVWKRTG